MLEKVTDRIYYMLNNDDTDRPVLGIVRGDDYCLVIDAGNSPKHAKEFIKEIEMLNFPPVKYLVITHHHWDHTFGLNEWDAVTIANFKTFEYMKTYCRLNYDDYSLEEAKDNGIFKDFSINCIKKELEDREEFHATNCSITFYEKMKIDLGGVTCMIKHIPSPHTDDSTIIYIPEEKTVFLGDCIYGYTYQGFNYYDRDQIYQMLEVFDHLDAQHFLCSHETICTKEEMEAFYNQLQMGAKVTKASCNLNDAIDEYKRIYGKEPNEEDTFFIRSFGIGDGWGRSGNPKPEMF